MAITYHSGERIQGLSYDNDASITPTFEDDLSNVWSGVGSNIAITSGELVSTSMQSSGDNRVFQSLGFSLVDTAWVLRFEYTPTSSSSGAYYMPIALTAGNGALNASADAVRLYIDMGSYTAFFRSKDGGTEGSSGQTVNLSAGTKYYFTVVNNNRSLTATIRTGSHSGSVFSTRTATIQNGVTGLDHIQSGASSFNGGTNTYTVDNIEIWNNMTSISGTATYTENFSSASVWTDDGDDVTINRTTNVIDWASLADGAEDFTYYDLTSVSDTKWIAQFDITFDTVTSGSDVDGTYLLILLDSVKTTPNSVGHDALGITYELDNTPSNNASIEVFSCDNLNLYDAMELNTPTGTVSVFTETAQASETQYIRLIRNGSTFTAEIYSDITRQTLVESKSVDADDGGTVSGLRYLKIATTRDNVGDHTFDGTIDNVKFYNGVTSINKPTNVPVYTRFEETDTRKMYSYREQVPNYDYTMTTDPRTNTFNVNTSYSTITYTGSAIKYTASSGSGQSGGSVTYIDLGSSLSNKFVIRYKNSPTGTQTYDSNSHNLFGISSVAPTTTGHITSTNWLGTRWYFGTQWSTANKLGFEPRIAQNSSSGNHNNSTSVDRLYGRPTDGTNANGTFYHELIWNVDTLTLNVYDNANYTGTPLATAELSSSSNTQWVTGTPSSVTGLRYLVYYQANDHQLGTFNLELDDIEIYDGVTSIT